MAVVGFIGAPASGKSTASSMLYTALLLNNFNSSVHVPEYAIVHLSKFGSISSPQDQVQVTTIQADKQLEYVDAGIKNIVCDSAMWIGQHYLKESFKTHYAANYKQEYDIMNSEVFIHTVDYDHIIFVPLSDKSKEGARNKVRVHSYEESIRIQDKLKEIVENNKDLTTVHYMPEKISDRAAWLNKFALKYGE